jgi:dihydroceramidase
MDGMLCDSIFVLVKYNFQFLTENRWHVFTAIGGYVAVATVDLIISGEVHQDPTDSLAWPAPLMARLVEPKLDFMKQK